MAIYYNINRTVEAQEIRTIDPNDGQLKNILDIAGGGGGGGDVDLTNYYTKNETDALFIPYYSSSQVDSIFSSHYTKSQSDSMLNDKLNVNNPTFTGSVKGGTYDTNGNTVLNINRNGSNILNVDVSNKLTINNHTDIDDDLTVRNKINTNIIDSYGGLSNIQFKHNNTLIYLEYDIDYEGSGGLILGKPLALATKLDIPLNSKLQFQHTDSYINETLNSGNFLNYVMMEQTGQMDFYVGDPSVGTNKVMTLQNNLITFHKPTSPEIGSGSVDLSNCVKLTGEASQAIAGDVVVSGTFDANTLNSNGNSDLVLQRNGVEYMKLEGTLQQVEFSKNVASNIYNSVGNANVSFRRNAIDFFYLRNNQVELNSGITLQSSSAKIDTINTAGDNDMALQRNGVEFIKFNGANRIDCSKNLRLALSNGELEFNDGLATILHRYSAPNNNFDIINENSTNPHIRMFIGNRNVGANIIVSASDNNVAIGRDLLVGSAYKVGTNNIDTRSDADLVFQRNSNTYMTFNQANDRIELAKSLKLPLNPARLEFTSCYMRESIPSNSLFDFVQENSDGVIRFFVGDLLNTNMPLYLNSSVVRCGENHTLLTNAMNTIGDVDMIFQRNGVEYMRFLNTANIDNVDVVSIPTGKGISAEYSYANYFRSRSVDTDLVFHGGNVAGNNRVEFMRYNRTGESLGRSIIGNLLDTSVSDEKLKKNIEDVDVDVSDIVKKINVKSFEYKDEKHGKGQQIGFLANELLDELPEVFSKNIIGKDKEDNLNMNYITVR
jgi:hypothetical protein